MITLRPYQERAIDALRDAYVRGRRAPCLVLPTGGGKTRIAAAIIQAAIARGRRVLFAAHRTELIDQTVAKLADVGVTDVRVIQAARDEGRADAPVIVGSIQTLTTDRWVDGIPAVDLAILDECHHAVCGSWRRVLKPHPRALLLGLTATPERGDGQPLGDLFDELVVGATVRELTDLGHLVPCRVWAPDRQLDAGKLALDPVDAYEQHGQGRPAIVFAATIAHARELAVRFGDRADVVTGTGSRDARRVALERFAAGELRVIVNVAVLTEGFDCPSAAVAILARRMRHAGTYLQMVGRVLRPAPGKLGATLVDLVGAVHEHGTPDLDRDYSLTGEAISKPVRLAIRQCSSCGSVFAAAAACPHCGAAVPVRPAELPRSTGVGVSDVTGSATAWRPPWWSALFAKREGYCKKCGRWFPRGTPVYWAKGKGTKHQRCPGPALPSAVEQPA